MHKAIILLMLHIIFLQTRFGLTAHQQYQAAYREEPQNSSHHFGFTFFNSSAPGTPFSFPVSSPISFKSISPVIDNNTYRVSAFSFLVINIKSWLTFSSELPGLK